MADTRLPQGDISTWDDDNLDEAPQRVGPMEELGVTGLKRVSGYVDEEFLPALRGRKAVRIYREMSCNDSMVGALLFTIDKLLREVEWKVLPADQTEENVLAQEFLESCMEDMSHSWDDFIGEVLSMITYGWSWHEIVYKRRLGSLAEGPEEAVQARGRPDRLAEDADPRAGDAAALGLRRVRRDQADGADGTAAVPDHGDPDREEHALPDQHRQGEPGGGVPTPHLLPVLVLQEAAGGVRGDRCRA